MSLSADKRQLEELEDRILALLQVGGLGRRERGGGGWVGEDGGAACGMHGVPGSPVCMH